MGNRIFRVLHAHDVTQEHVPFLTCLSAHHWKETPVPCLQWLQIFVVVSVATTFGITIEGITQMFMPSTGDNLLEYHRCVCASLPPSRIFAHRPGRRSSSSSWSKTTPGELTIRMPHSSWNGVQVYPALIAYRRCRHIL
jgi:hypothetical protein